MILLDRALSAIGLERRSTTAAPGGDSYWSDFQALRSGPVNAATAQSVSAVYACVAAVSETVASLPLILFRRAGEDRERATDHPLYRVLHDQANPHMTALELRELMQAQVLLRGNSFARIVTGWDGQVRELWPLPVDTSVLRLPDGKLAYEYTDKAGKRVRLLSDEVLHLKHRVGDDAVLGVSPIAAAREVVQLALAERQHGTAMFEGGTRLSGVLTMPGVLKDNQRDSLKASWKANYSGAKNSGGVPILEAGMTYQAISMTADDAQYLASRQFSVEEVCRLFRVPPTLVGDLRHGNYSNSVELARQFVTLTLRRHLLMWEQGIASKLLTEAGRRIYFAEHQVEGLLRGDSVNRASFYSSGIKDGWMLPSEARRLENLPTVPGIDDKPATGEATPAPLPYPSKQ